MRSSFLVAAAASIGALVAGVPSCTPFERGAEPDLSDGGPVGDAHSGSVVDASDSSMPGSFCAGQNVLLCDDFERSDVAGGWTLESGTGKASLAIDDTVAASSSRSLRSSLSSEDSWRFLRYPLQANARRIEVSFAMRFASEVRGAQFVAFGFEDTPKNRIYVSWAGGSNPSVLRLVEQDDLADPTGIERYFSEDLGPPPMGRFVRYTLEVDLEAKEARVTSEDPAVSGTLHLTLPHSQPSFVGIGNIYAAARKEDVSVWFDDVVIR
ncbi:MAG: hypothetical protein K0S65_3833 [Labilithrix sp.]|nr:hypothetical protein [Labilithrix sp.]